MYFKCFLYETEKTSTAASYSTQISYVTTAYEEKIEQGKGRSGRCHSARIQGSMKDYSSSVDREQLRRIKYGTTPEQRMNWLVDAVAFARESSRGRKPHEPGHRLRFGGAGSDA